MVGPRVDILHTFRQDRQFSLYRTISHQPLFTPLPFKMNDALKLMMVLAVVSQHPQQSSGWGVFLNYIGYKAFGPDKDKGFHSVVPYMHKKARKILAEYLKYKTKTLFCYWMQLYRSLPSQINFRSMNPISQYVTGPIHKRSITLGPYIVRMRADLDVYALLAQVCSENPCPCRSCRISRQRAQA